MKRLLADAAWSGGSRAQEDLVELTVFWACIEVGRRDAFQRRLAALRWPTRDGTAQDARGLFAKVLEVGHGHVTVDDT